MDIFSYILISTFLISLLAFVGAIILFLKEKFLDRVLLILVSFAAGALIGGAFLHLIPEVIEQVGSEESLLKVFFYLLFVEIGYDDCLHRNQNIQIFSKCSLLHLI